MTHKKAGFTLVEIMIVLVIIGIIGTFGLRKYTAHMRTAKITQTKVELRSTDSAITMYKNQLGQYPAALQDLIDRPSDPALAAKWHGSFLDKDEIPKDAWGEELQYERAPKGTKPPFKLFSYGPNCDEGEESGYIDSTTE